MQRGVFFGKAADHGPVPGLAAGILADGHALLVEPVGDGRAVARGLEPAEPFGVDQCGGVVLLPVVVSFSSIWLEVAEDLAGGGPAELLEAVHLLLLDPLRRVGVVADVVAAGRDHVLLPGVLGGVDAVVGGENASAVIDGDAAKPDRVGPPDDPADVLGD